MITKLLEAYFEGQSEIVDTTSLQTIALWEFANALGFRTDDAVNDFQCLQRNRFYHISSTKRKTFISWKTVQSWYNYPKAFEIVSGKVIRISQLGKTRMERSNELKKFCNYDYFWNEAHRNKPFEKIYLQYHKKTKSFKAQKNLLKLNKTNDNQACCEAGI